MKYLVWALIILAACSRQRVERPQADALLVPLGDHHTHLSSPDDSVWMSVNYGDDSPRRTAKELVAALDSAHMRRALVLSTAYWFGAPDAVPDSTRDEYTRVRADNDWVAAQVAQYPSRLVGFCAVNPLREYALREIARCKTVGLRGLKLHFANARLSLDNPDHVKKARAVFAAANAERLPIVVHLRGLPPYGTRQAQIFIKQVLPAAPDVPVQLAHLAGWGSYDQSNDDGLVAFIDAMKSGEIDRSHLYFDLAAVFLVVSEGVKVDPAASRWTPVIVRRMREIGLDRMLFATDSDADGIQSAIATFLLHSSGLKRGEVRRVFDNLAPYLR